MASVSVWIDEGCIVCDACEETYPEVFHVTEDTCFIKADSRTDGNFDTNQTSKSVVKDDIDLEILQEAADGCPVDVIIIETMGGGASEGDASEAPAEVEPEVVAPAVAEVPAAAEVSMGGDRSLLVLFGTQSGNSEDLCAKIGKSASTYGLEATVKGMDEIQIGDLAGQMRVLIVCSTWGEGDMPDNAEDLWVAANGDGAPNLAGTHFSICALGDTSYEFYCQSGIDWDVWFEKQGANRVVARVDCDVDYDEMANGWVAEALPHIAAVDGDGVYQEDAVEALKAKAAGGKTAVAAGSAFDIPAVERAELQVNIRVFRYDAVSGESGHDVWACAIPGHLSVTEVLRLLKATEDGSLTFRDGSPDDATTGLLVNGRLILPGRVALADIATTRNGESSLRIDPLPGYDVIRDLVVDHSDYQTHLSASKPWMRGATRGASQLEQGVMGTMEAPLAATLHIAGDIASYQLLHSASDTTPHNRSYVGPAVVARLWARCNDSRLSAAGRASHLEVVQGPNGIKAEADMSSIHRQGRMGAIAALALLEAKTATLEADGFTGRHGKHVWWFTETVKFSGQLNETTLAGATLGPFGMAKNALTGILPRMALGFTRNGAPMMRDLQALFMPPGSVGKMPKIINSKVDDHHEIVALYNAFDRRF